MSQLMVQLACLLLCLTPLLAQSPIDWLSDSDYYRFLSSFNLLDYNADGLVTLNEAKLGILSMLDASYLDQLSTDNNGQFAPEVYEKYHDFQPTTYNCIPSLIPMDFVDCLIMSVRHNTAAKEDVILNLDTLLPLYFSTCTDISPLSDTSCSLLVKETSSVCAKSSSTFCEISCFKCSHSGAMLFSPNPPQTDATTLFVAPSIIPNLSALRANTRSETSAMTGKHNAVLAHRKLSSSPIGSSLSKAHVQRGHVCPMKATTKHVNRNRFVLMSDPHIEPWYDPDSTSYISRFEDYSVANMFECRNSDNKVLDTKTSCTLTGFSDPPLSLFVSALHAWNMYARRPEDSVLFLVGDMQAHSYLNDHEAVSELMYTVVDNLLRYFDPDSIFIAPGNNDGKHNSIFTTNQDEEGEKMTESWANVLLDRGIVSDILMKHHNYFVDGVYYTCTSLFRLTGYYMKLLSKIESNYFVIVLNTNLGAMNPTQQAVFESDLEFVRSNDGKVAVLGHHPSVVRSMIPIKYLEPLTADDDVLLGVFSGHIHYFDPTDELGFTTLPAMTQFAPYSAFAMTDMQDYVGVDGKSRKKIKVTEENLVMYVGTDHEIVDSHCWQ